MAARAGAHADVRAGRRGPALAHVWSVISSEKSTRVLDAQFRPCHFDEDVGLAAVFAMTPKTCWDGKIWEGQYYRFCGRGILVAFVGMYCTR